jgi:hypothetical protein
MPDLEDDQEWELEEVRDCRRFHSETQYFVKWKGWPSEYNQWLMEEDMGNAQELIRQYRVTQERRGKRKQKP